MTIKTEGWGGGGGFKTDTAEKRKCLNKVPNKRSDPNASSTTVVLKTGGARCPLCGFRGLLLRMLQRIVCTVKGYHQTNAKAARLILEGKVLSRHKVSRHLFATSAKDAETKAHQHGVSRGNVQEEGRYLTKGVYGRTYGNKKEGYDSVRITRLRTGDEIVVYNYGQVSNIKRL